VGDHIDSRGDIDGSVPLGSALPLLTMSGRRTLKVEKIERIYLGSGRRTVGGS